MTWRDGMKKAFEVDPPGPATPTQRQSEIVDRLCKGIVRRGLTTPTLMALEMGRPLNFVTAQAMHFFRPIASIVLDGQAIKAFALLLEQRGSVEYLCRRLEFWDQADPTPEDLEGATDAPSASTDDGDGPSNDPARS
jgi:hypothetical protein